jgi:predicted Fe-Mo cluster-binding NifX family protein
MKILVTTILPDIRSDVDPRFGRAAYFLEIDPDTLEWNALPNPAHAAWGSAGVQAAQFVADRKPAAVISGNFGSNAYTALEAAGIAMYLKSEGTAQEAVAEFQAGLLERAGAPTRAAPPRGGRV